MRPSNIAARRLYESEGLIEAGLRPGYYEDSEEPALIMWGDIAPTAQACVAARDPESLLVLAIESSCDETAAAVIRGSREVLASVVASQVDFHARFGGVVPEIASRKHTEAIVAVVDEVLTDAGKALAGESDADERSGQPPRRHSRSPSSTRSQSRTVPVWSARSSSGSHTRKGSRSRPVCRSWA